MEAYLIDKRSTISGRAPGRAIWTCRPSGNRFRIDVVGNVPNVTYYVVIAFNKDEEGELLGEAPVEMPSRRSHGRKHWLA
jgi:hypothetical protein